jgi:hypothetical protein
MRPDPDRPVVAALLDQRVMAGVGNLWANQISCLQGVSPWTRVGDTDVEALVDLAATALRRSIGGTGQVTTGDTRGGESHWVSGPSRSPVQALRHDYPRHRGGEWRPGAPAHVVVPALPTRAHPSQGLMARKTNAARRTR